jgi:hypothetical protein
MIECAGPALRLGFAEDAAGLGLGLDAGFVGGDPGFGGGLAGEGRDRGRVAVGDRDLDAEAARGERDDFVVRLGVRVGFHGAASGRAGPRAPPAPGRRPWP